jgi:hypothetical protein
MKSSIKISVELKINLAKAIVALTALIALLK